MEERSAFVGSIPENYDRLMGPIFFEPYAEDLAERLRASGAKRVLELACGTGIVTRRLLEVLPADGMLVATDLNEPMIEQARAKFGAGDRVEFRQADALALPFPDGAFDAVVCQFGVMFFPDKPRSFREASRVLAPGGTYLFNVWRALAENELTAVADHAIARFFPDDPPDFFATPFGFHDAQSITLMLARAGFDRIEIVTVEKPGVSASARDAAVGLLQGTPMAGQLAARAPGSVPAIVDAAAAAIRERFGDNPVRSTMSALVCRARRRSR